MRERFRELLEELRLMNEDENSGAIYFSQEEHNETLRGGQTLADEPFVYREYTYSCSGATYSG